MIIQVFLRYGILNDYNMTRKNLYIVNTPDWPEYYVAASTQQEAVTLYKEFFGDFNKNEKDLEEEFSKASVNYKEEILV